MSAHAPAVWETTVWRLESGFFARDAELAAAMQSHQFSTRVVPEIDEATQFFRVRVEAADLPTPGCEVWVIFVRAPGHAAALARAAQLPDLNSRLAQLRPQLLAALPDAKFCFVTDDREGYARLIDPDTMPVTFASGSWD